MSKLLIVLLNGKISLERLQGTHVERTSFLIPGIGRRHASKLGDRYGQASIFYKDSAVSLKGECVKVIFPKKDSLKKCEEFELYERYLINTRLGFTQYRIILDRKAGSYEDQ